MVIRFSCCTKCHFYARAPFSAVLCQPLDQLDPQWTPPLPSALLFILASSCNEPSPAFYIFLHHFLLENGAAFVWKQCRDFFFHARTTNTCPSAKYSIGVCKLNQLRSPRWKGAQSVEVLGRFCARQNNMNTIFSAHILVWIIPQ